MRWVSTITRSSFFFQAEDGIRDHCVIGVQTCAFFFSSRRRHTRSLCDWSSDGVLFRSTLLCVSKTDFKKILSMHVEFSEAMLRLHARRIRQLYGLVEDLNTLPLRARLAKQLLHLVRSYGVTSPSDGSEIRNSLHLAQE